jgi:hypothetical protein
MDNAAVSIEFVRGDRALLIECVFPGVTSWAGCQAYLDCRIGGESTPRVFALSHTASADGVIELLAGNEHGLTGNSLRAWLEPAKSATVPAGDYEFGLRVIDSLGAPITHLTGPVQVQPSPTVQP